MTLDDVLARFEAGADPANVAGMARFGIRSRKVYGLSVTQLRRLAREAGSDHRLAQRLWATRSHEGRILAALVEDPERVTEAQLERWVRAFDNWAVCDTCCLDLFCRLPLAHRKAAEWSRRPEEFVKRAAFALMAGLAWHDKAAKDAAFLRFLPIIAREADDDRNYVKKAVSWALRQIGKRNSSLGRAAIRAAEQLGRSTTRSARWIGADALRDLRSRYS